MIRKYEKKIYDQEQLLQISKALNSNLELSFLIETILNIIIVHAQTMHAVIFVSENYSEEKFLLFSKCMDFDDIDARDIKLILKKPLIELLTNEKEPIYLESLKEKVSKKDFRESSFDKIQVYFTNPLLLPLVFHKTLVGLLLLGERQNATPYSPSQLDFFLNLSNIAAIAINNAKLYYIATTDYLTMLKTHQFFQTKIEEHLIVTQKNNSPLSLLLLDIDFFKSINDNYGHLIGDFILKQVAQIFYNIFACLDCCFRYGGEEFVAILPNTTLNEAKKIAEQLRIKIKQKEFQTTQEKTLSLTVSIGVTQYQEQDRHKDVFIERCDQALYLAKNNGRNRVESL